jgi:hypothetical protein
MRKVALCTLLAAVILAAWRPAAALEAGTSTYLHGYKDFLSGIVPPEEGWYFRNDLVYYTGDISRTVVGGRVSVGLSEELVADLPAASYVAPFRILGANYAFRDQRQASAWRTFRRAAVTPSTISAAISCGVVTMSTEAGS